MPSSHQQRFRALAALSAAALLAACGSSGGGSSSTAAPATTPATTPAPAATGGSATTAAAGADLTALVDAAKKEGQVNLIALPDSWANYKGILQSFRDKYDIKNPVATPDAASADEITAVKTLKGQANQPDSIDVGPSFATQLKDEGLVEPYKVSTWDQIPDSLKDPDGNWVAAYYGILAIGTNTTIVKDPPRTIADLMKPAYKGLVALNGDPRTSGAAFAGVMAASLANGGSFDDIMPGIQFFADLKKAGNFLPVDPDPSTILAGETPIVLDWTYNWPGLLPQLKAAGYTTEVVVPSDGVYGSYYVQGVVKGSPHPNAGKLWVEHILSDDGALGYLEGGAIPARYAALVAAGKVGEEQKKNLPSQDVIQKISFPTDAQIATANKVIVANWGTMVAGN